MVVFLLMFLYQPNGPLQKRKTRQNRPGGVDGAACRGPAGCCSGGPAESSCGAEAQGGGFQGDEGGGVVPDGAAEVEARRRCFFSSVRLRLEEIFGMPVVPRGSPNGSRSISHSLPMAPAREWRAKEGGLDPSLPGGAADLLRPAGGALSLRDHMAAPAGGAAKFGAEALGGSALGPGGAGPHRGAGATACGAGEGGDGGRWKRCLIATSGCGSK